MLALAALAPFASSSCATASPPAPAGPRFAPFTHPDVPAGTTVEAPDPIQTPHPPLAEIAATQTAMFKKGNHVGRVYFCVHPSGVTEAVTTTLSTADEKLDAVLRDAVARWTFRPARAQAGPTRACTQTEFNMKFR